jgi:tol-pal system protein YbgF
MRDALTRVQSHHDGLDQRLSTLEVQRSGPSPMPRAPGPAPAPGSARGTDRPAVPTPELRVVRIAPENESDATDGVDADPDDRAVRPTVRITGSRDRRKGRASAEITEFTEPQDRTTPAKAIDAAPALGTERYTLSGPSEGSLASDAGNARPSALDPLARRAYDSALAQVYAKKYDSALEALAGFLLKWPDHPYADNAHYWRGECYFAKGEYARAEEQFSGVVLGFPLGNKAADALLKLALTQDRLGKTKDAEAQREKLRREYPRSDAFKKLAGYSPKKETP